MTFTKDIPTTPGFYAWRFGQNFHTDMVEIYPSGSRLFAWRDGKGCHEKIWKAWGGEWCRLVPAEEVEKAYREGWMHRDKYNYQPCDIAFNAHSRAKRVMEGKKYD